jgi:hypothetical protein
VPQVSNNNGVHGGGPGGCSLMLFLWEELLTCRCSTGLLPSLLEWTLVAQSGEMKWHLWRPIRWRCS